jgi:four helix bundle protein
MSGIRNFTDLEIWRRTRAWSKSIFQLTQKAPFARDQRLVIQINDSSESVMSNIAEGFGRGTQEEFITFLGYALGSLMETQSHLCAAYDREYLSKDVFGDLFSEGTAIRKMTVGFIQSMILPRGAVKTRKRTKTWTNQVWEIYERVTAKPRPELFHDWRDGERPRNRAASAVDPAGAANGQQQHNEVSAGTRNSEY